MANLHTDTPASTSAAPAGQTPIGAELLAHLLNQGALQPAPVTHTPARRRRTTSTYEVVIGKIALLVALVIVCGLWGVGGSFTLAWVSSIGLPISQLGPLAWAIPIAVTVLEVGIVAIRARTPWAWLAWLIVLAFDAYTTAAGGLLFAEQQRWIVARDITIWAIAGAAGLGIALVPEPAGRSLVRELLD